MAICCGLGQSLIGQETNPFDLVPRLETNPYEANDTAIEYIRGINNPFDVQPPPNGFVSPSAPLTSLEEVAPIADLEITKQNRFFSFLTLIIFLLTTLLVIFFRIYFGRIYNAFINENLLNQLYRERETGNVIPFYALYSLFILNLAVFIVNLIRLFGLRVPGSNFQLFFNALIGVFALVVLRHLSLNIIAGIFPVEKELKLYSFSINVFNIIIGIFLIPINLLLFYIPENAGKIIVYAGVVAVILIYLFRSFRGLLIANKYFQLYKFHFFLYICVVELVPLVVLVKLVYSGL